MPETRASERDDECVVGEFVLAYHCYYTRLLEIFQLFLLDGFFAPISLRGKYSQVVYPHLFASYPHFNRGSSFLWINSTPVVLLALIPLLYFSRLWKSRFFLILKGVIV